MFYNKENPYEFIRTRKYKRGRKEFNSLIEFSNYVFSLPEELDESENNLYVMKKEKENKYNVDELKWKKIYIDDFVVIERR